MSAVADFLKEDGMELVLHNTPEDWKATYDLLANQFYREVGVGGCFSGEDVHEFIAKNCVWHPDKPQAWSAKFSGFIRPHLKDGTVVISEFRKSNKASNHSHFYRIYKRVA